MDSRHINEAVNARYTAIAEKALEGTTGPQKDYDTTATGFGYQHSDLAYVPEGANLGLSCGAPLTLADLQRGETVLDLGSGGGLDCLLAARIVGPGGRVIGIDRSTSMLELAMRNAKKMGVEEFVEFVKGDLVDMPLDRGIVNVILSNCVLNLLPQAEKPVVFREMFRVLKPGGRVAVSDVLARQEMPEHIQKDIALLVGCVAGASLVEEYSRWMTEAGFEDVRIADTGSDINTFKIPSCGGEEDRGKGCGCCGSKDDATTLEDNGRNTWQDLDFNSWVGSYYVSARKPCN